MRRRVNVRPLRLCRRSGARLLVAEHLFARLRCRRGRVTGLAIPAPALELCNEVHIFSKLQGWRGARYRHFPVILRTNR